MQNRKFLLFSVLIVFCIVFGINSVHAKVYKTATSLAISGPTSDAGSPYAKGIEDYFKFVNDTKILGKDTIDCIIKDDQYQTSVTKRNFEEFLDEEIVIYLNYSTSSTLSLKKDFEEEKIPVLPASYHAGNIVDSKYIFLPVASYSEQLVALSEYVVDNHKGKEKPKVALFVHPSAFGRGPVEDTQKAVAAGLGMDIVEVFEHGQDLDNTATLKRLLSKGVQYVLCHTVQAPVATLLKDSARLGLTAKTYGEKDKLTFLGVHYTGGNDIIDLAGKASEGYIWTCSFNLTSENNEGAKQQLALAAKYGRDKKIANSHNYAGGILVAQITTEVIKRLKDQKLSITKENIYNELNKMNGDKAYSPYSVIGPVTFSPTDRSGVDMLQIYTVKNGVFKKIGLPIRSKFIEKIK